MIRPLGVIRLDHLGIFDGGNFMAGTLSTLARVGKKIHFSEKCDGTSEDGGFHTDVYSLIPSAADGCGL